MKRTSEVFALPAEEETQKRKGTFEIREQVHDWVICNSQSEFVYGRTKQNQDVQYFYSQTKESMAKSFARHHNMVDGQAVFTISGESDPNEPSLTTFSKHWPDHCKKAKWYDCVCLKCHEMNMALEDLLELTKAAHKGQHAYLQLAAGIAGKVCQDTDCFWNKPGFY